VTETISRYLLQHDALYYSLLAINVALILFAPWIVRRIAGSLKEWREREGALSERFWINVLRG